MAVTADPRIIPNVFRFFPFDTWVVPHVLLLRVMLSLLAIPVRNLCPSVPRNKFWDTVKVRKTWKLLVHSAKSPSRNTWQHSTKGCLSLRPLTTHPRLERVLQSPEATRALRFCGDLPKLSCPPSKGAAGPGCRRRAWRGTVHTWHLDDTQRHDSERLKTKLKWDFNF